MIIPLKSEHDIERPLIENSKDTLNLPFPFILLREADVEGPVEWLLSLWQIIWCSVVRYAVQNVPYYLKE